MGYEKKVLIKLNLYNKKKLLKKSVSKVLLLISIPVEKKKMQSQMRLQKYVSM